VLTEASNLGFVHWAALATVPDLIHNGCHVHLTPPPFDHSKLLLVDGRWALVGSANWDARSLRLNFEYNLECHDRALSNTLDGYFEARLARSRRLELSELRGQPLWKRLRNSTARLLSPYL